MLVPKNLRIDSILNAQTSFIHRERTSVKKGVAAG